MYKLIYKHRLYLIAGFIVTSLLLLFFNFSAPIPSVASASISPHQTNVLLDAPLTLTFSSPLSSTERRRLTFHLIPSVSDSSAWDGSYTIVRLNPHSSFIKKTSYTLEVLYKNKSIYTLSFSTNPYDEADLRDQANKQAADDLIFGQKVSESLQQRPWLTSLPIRTPSYYIYFDTPSKQFLLYFIVPRTQTLEQQAVDDLKKIGVPTQDLKYSIVVD